MKKAVIQTGGKQYLVAEGDVIDVELLKDAKDKTTFKPLLVIDGDNVQIGQPVLEQATVAADIVAQDIQAEKVMAIRYKSKKRVRKVRGHRQHFSQIKITSIK